MEEIDNLITEMTNIVKKFLGARVLEASYLIWPCDESFVKDYPNIDINKIPMELNLSLKLESGDIIGRTFCVDGAGLALTIWDEEVKAKYKISELKDRVGVWLRPDYWDTRDQVLKEQDNDYLREDFDIEGSKEYKGVIGSKINKIVLYYLEELLGKEEDLPIGICFELSSDKKIWVIVDGGDESFVSTNFPEWIYKIYSKKEYPEYNLKTLELSKTS